MSQSLAMKEYLEESGHEIIAVFAGSRKPGDFPAYFAESFKGKLESFHSPYLLRTPNKKGIYIARTLLFNLFRVFVYLRELHRLRREINSREPGMVFNFYDVVGALALRKLKPGIRRVGVGHHFFLHLEGYRCNGGSAWHRGLLKKHTRVIMRSCDRILALSYRDAEDDPLIQVVPPLIRKSFREISYHPEDRYLVYLLHEGYLYDLIRISREDPGFQADVFTAGTTEMDLPPGIRIHPPDADAFRERMGRCRGLITTAGFDTVAEAAYLGIPLAVVPSQHHFEQRCNGADVERSGIGMSVNQLIPGIQQRIETFDNREYRNWVNRAAELINKSLQE